MDFFQGAPHPNIEEDSSFKRSNLSQLAKGWAAVCLLNAGQPQRFLYVSIDFKAGKKKHQFRQVFVSFASNRFFSEGCRGFSAYKNWRVVQISWRLELVPCPPIGSTSTGTLWDHSSHIWLVVSTYPSEKWWSSSMGRMTSHVWNGT